MLGSRSHPSFRILETAVKAFIASQSVIEGAGLFNSALIEALVRAFHERQSDPGLKRGQNAFTLGGNDYKRASELV